MATIIVIKKDGERREFSPQSRAGGSYCNRVRYEGAFVIVTDEYGAETAFPAADVSEVRTHPDHW